jgi:hypothetical protein
MSDQLFRLDNSAVPRQATMETARLRTTAGSREEVLVYLPRSFLIRSITSGG